MKLVPLAAQLLLGLQLWPVLASRKAGEAVATGTASSATFSAAGQQRADPVDTALDYLSKRIHAAQRGNKRLAERLAAAEREGATTRSELTAAAARLEIIPGLRKRADDLLAEKAKALSELSRAWIQETSVKAQLENVSKVSLKHERTIARARVRLSQLLRDHAELTKRLKDVTSHNKDLSNTVASLKHDYDSLMRAEQAKERELGRTRAFIANLQGSFHALQATEEQDRSKLEATTIAKDQALESWHQAEINQKSLSQDRDNLARQLTDLSAKEKLEAKYNQELSDRLSVESLATAKRSEADDADSRARSEAASRESSLRQEVLDLKRKLADAESSGQQVKDQMLSTKDDLFSAESEAQQAQGAVPALEAKVAEEKAEIANATALAAEASRERDATKAAFTAARQQVLHLERQYSDLVKLVGKSAAKGAGADGDAVSEAVGGVEKDLTTLAGASAVPDSPVHAQGGAKAGASAQPPPPPPPPEADSAPVPEFTVTRSLRGAPPIVSTGLSQGLERDSAGLEQLLVGIVADD